MNDYPTTLRVIAAFKAGEDLAVRLESAVKAQNAMADALRNAADYIERLQNESYSQNDGKHGVADTNRANITETEREAIEQAIDAANGMAQAEPWTAATLHELLKRLK